MAFAKNVYIVVMVVFLTVKEVVAVLKIVEELSVVLMLEETTRNAVLLLLKVVIEVKNEILFYLDNFYFIPSL